MNKRKILEAARKHAQKGAKDKALKEYQKLLKLDPRDAKLRLEVGDAYRRWGQVEEAVATYAKVAEQYMKDGFDARAVAVYKQIQNLDPTRYDCYESLAEVYQRMGLMAEAINTLQLAADGHHREGRKREALDLLRKMATIDPSNTTSRIKVADLLRQEGLGAEAAAEYREVAAEFERQGDVEALGSVMERILEVEPDCIPVVIQLANNLMGQGLADRAEPFAKRALEANPNEPESYELLSEVYRAQNRGDELIDVYRRLADLYDQREDAERARDIRQRFIPPDDFSPESSDAEIPVQEELLEEERLSGDVSEFLEESTLVGDESGFLQSSTLTDGASADAPEEAMERDVSELLGDDFLADESPSGWDETGEIDAENPADRPSDLESPTGEHRVESGLVEETVVTLDRDEGVDPEQILAEASVYLRYGKQEQAIESLERLLEFDPRHRTAMEKLGDAFAASKQSERAVEVWLRAAKRAQEDEDELALEVLRDRIAALDEGAAAALEPESTAAGPVDSQDYLDVSQPVLPDFGSEDTPSPDAAEEGLGDDLEAEFDIDDIELDVDPSELEDEDERVEVQAEAESTAVGSQLKAEAESTPVATPAEAELASQSSASGSSSVAMQVGEELEEADFYMQQGLVDEAEAVYQRLLKVAPNHPLVMVRLGEIAAARGQDPAAAGSAEAAELEAPASEPPAEEELSSQVLEDAGEPTDLDLGDEPEAALEDDLGIAAEAEDSAASESELSFDLAAALSDVFDEDPNESTSSGLSGADEDGFAAVFSEFKKGVSKTLSEGDHEAHYDLGIAYREMGLLDDAMGEFRAAMGSPALQIDSLHMLGLCATDVGRPQDAITHLEQALAQPHATREQQLAARFELGRAFEALGDLERARGAYEAVAAVDPLFCEVEDRLVQIDDASKPAEESGGAEAALAEEFESFDDVIEEANAEFSTPEVAQADVTLELTTPDVLEADPTVEIPACEVAEADESSAAELEPESVPDVAAEPEPLAAPEPELEPTLEPAAAPEPELEPTLEPAAAPEPEPTPEPRRRKKKISFV